MPVRFARRPPAAVPPRAAAAPQGDRDRLRHYHGAVHPPRSRSGRLDRVTDEPLPVDDATAWATTPASGAVVVFLGVVRDHADGRAGVTGLTYEAYEEEAVAEARRVAAEARRRWPVDRAPRAAAPHRRPRALRASVAVVVSSPHRAEAFEAARFCIDTLKETVPIWKREHWEGGSDWGTGARRRPCAAAVG